MSLGIFQATIVDEFGNVQAGAEIQVFDESTGLLAELFSDKLGTALDNPFFTSSDGFAEFYANNGEYRISAVKGLFSRTWRYVQIGDTAQRDTGKDFDQVPLNTNIVYPVATVADLRNLEPTVDGQRFNVTSYYDGWAATVRGPVGGGEFVYDASDTTSVENGGTIIVTAGGKRFKSKNTGNLSAEMFGAHPALASATQNTTAINNCIVAQFDLGGGRPTIGTGEFEIDGTITAIRKVVLVGNGDLPTVIKLADNSNVDMVKSENFDALTGTNDTTTNTLCPYSFGFENLQLNGNKSNQTSGYGCKLYGPRLILDKFMVYNCKQDGLYSEYSDQIGSATPEGQEEGSIGSVISRDNDGNGWLYRGPHNTVIDNYIGAYNGDWGFKNERSAGVYDGNITLINHIHTYANGLITGQNNESYFGAVTSINYLIVDGGYSEVASGDCQISMIKLIFGGQTNHGLIVSGSFNNIGMFNGSMLTGTSGFDVLRVTGNNNYVGRTRVTGQLNSHDGVVVLGTGNQIENIDARECLRGAVVTGGLNKISGTLSLCTDSFSYSIPAGAHPGKNDIDLNIYQTSGNYVIGDRPVDQIDSFNIRATGQGNLYTSAEIESVTIPLDTTAVQAVSVPHGLLYTPTRQSVSLTRLTSSPTDTAFESGDLRVTSTDATNINIELVMHTAAVAGTLGRVGVKVKI